MKENKLIAEFMEYPNLGTKGDFSYLKYHKSWDWLIPVVESIERVHEGVPQELMNVSLFSTIDEVYNAVVEFINEYNKTK